MTDAIQFFFKNTNNPLIKNLYIDFYIGQIKNEHNDFFWKKIPFRKSTTLNI